MFSCEKRFFFFTFFIFNFGTQQSRYARVRVGGCVCACSTYALMPTKSHAAFARLVRVRVFVTRPLAEFSCVIHINTPPPRRCRFGELLVLAATSAVDVPPLLPTAAAAVKRCRRLVNVRGAQRGNARRPAHVRRRARNKFVGPERRARCVPSPSISPFRRGRRSRHGAARDERVTNAVRTQTDRSGSDHRVPYRTVSAERLARPFEDVPVGVFFPDHRPGRFADVRTM